MQNIPIALARPGMVLAREVVHPQRPNGPVLFGRGAEVTGAALDRLHRIGVASITVEGRPVQVEGEDDLETQLDRLALRFRSVGDDAFMMNMKRIIELRIRRSFNE